MSKSIKLRKGLDIRLLGEAKTIKSELPMSKIVSIKPSDFHRVIPKLVVKEGDSIKAGGVLFHDKYEESVKFASPISGTVKAVIRGEKRRILEVQIESDGQQSFESESTFDLANMSSQQVKETMLASGLWPFINQRPIDVVADPKNQPEAIFVSAFSSAPLGPD